MSADEAEKLQNELNKGLQFAATNGLTMLAQTILDSPMGSQCDLLAAANAAVKAGAYGVFEQLMCRGIGVSEVSGLVSMAKGAEFMERLIGFVERAGIQLLPQAARHALETVAKGSLLDPMEDYSSTAMYLLQEQNAPVAIGGRPSDVLFAACFRMEANPTRWNEVVGEMIDRGAVLDVGNLATPAMKGVSPDSFDRICAGIAATKPNNLDWPAALDAYAKIFVYSAGRGHAEYANALMRHFDFEAEVRHEIRQRAESISSGVGRKIEAMFREHDLALQVGISESKSRPRL